MLHTQAAHGGGNKWFNRWVVAVSSATHMPRRCVPVHVRVDGDGRVAVEFSRLAVNSGVVGLRAWAIRETHRCHIANLHKQHRPSA